MAFLGYPLSMPLGDRLSRPTMASGFSAKPVSNEGTATVQSDEGHATVEDDTPQTTSG